MLRSKNKNKVEEVRKEVEKKEKQIKSLEKIEKEAKQKKNNIREDIEKMLGKIGIKDGKLIKKDDPKPGEPGLPPEVQQESPQQMPPQPPVNVGVQGNQYAGEFEEPQLQPQYQQPQAPQYQQPQAPQYQQPQAPQYQQPRVPEMLNVTTHLTEGEVITISVDSTQVQDLLGKLGEAIDNQSMIALGTRFINGRHIIFYTVQ